MSDPKVGVLLANLGTPDAPTPSAVRRFLGEFLSDRRVIDYPRIVWLPILYGAILQIRPRKTAEAYKQIWTDAGSPLLVQSKALANALQNSLRSIAHVSLGMTYGSPSIASAIHELNEKGIEQLIVVPLYPQYSRTTTASVRDRVDAALRKLPNAPRLVFIEHYHDEPAYLDALAQSVREHRNIHGRKHLLFSFHGIPKRYVDNGDPYYAHCLATAEGVTQRLQLSKQEWTVAFQSRVGRELWLEPYTDKLLLEYAQTGPKDLSVVCPAFATDCLETLEEIALRDRELFLHAGGASFDYIPCLNARADHVAMFAQLIRHSLSSAGQSPVASRQ